MRRDPVPDALERLPRPAEDGNEPPRCVRLRGARFAAITEAEAVERIVHAASRKRGHWTITANLDHLHRYDHEPIARKLIDDADLVVADGMPVIWASRLAGVPLPERIAGSSMIWTISDAARERGHSIFLLGGGPGVARSAARVLLTRYDGLKIVGTLCPPTGFDQDGPELHRVERTVAQAAPQIVFVALGFPKQDLLIKRLRRVLPQTSFIGVGIGLSFVAGEVSRAPGWVRHLGFEWLFRLLQEPRRLAHRYLIAGIPFAVRLLGAATYHRIGIGRARPHWGQESEVRRT